MSSMDITAYYYNPGYIYTIQEPTIEAYQAYYQTYQSSNQDYQTSNDGISKEQLSLQSEQINLFEVEDNTFTDPDSIPLPKELTDMFKLLECELCEVTVGCETSAFTHYEGKTHIKNVNAYMKEHYNIYGSLKVGKERFAPVTCEVCNIELTSKVVCQQHFNGKQHLKNLKKKQYNIPSIPVDDSFTVSNDSLLKDLPPPPSPPILSDFVCEICNITTNTEQQLLLHKNGLKHKKKLNKLKEVHMDTLVDAFYNNEWPEGTENGFVAENTEIPFVENPEMDYPLQFNVDIPISENYETESKKDEDISASVISSVIIPSSLTEKTSEIPITLGIEDGKLLCSTGVFLRQLTAVTQEVNKELDSDINSVSSNVINVCNSPIVAIGSEQNAEFCCSTGQVKEGIDVSEQNYTFCLEKIIEQPPTDQTPNHSNEFKDRSNYSNNKSDTQEMEDKASFKAKLQVEKDTHISEINYKVSYAKINIAEKLETNFEQLQTSDKISNISNGCKQGSSYSAPKGIQEIAKNNSSNGDVTDYQKPAESENKSNELMSGNICNNHDPMFDQELTKLAIKEIEKESIIFGKTKDTTKVLISKEVPREYENTVLNSTKNTKSKYKYDMAGYRINTVRKVQDNFRENDYDSRKNCVNTSNFNNNGHRYDRYDHYNWYQNSNYNYYYEQNKFNGYFYWYRNNDTYDNKQYNKRIYEKNKKRDRCKRYSSEEERTSGNKSRRRDQKEDKSSSRRKKHTSYGRRRKRCYSSDDTHSGKSRSYSSDRRQRKNKSKKINKKNERKKEVVDKEYKHDSRPRNYKSDSDSNSSRSSNSSNDHDYRLDKEGLCECQHRCETAYNKCPYKHKKPFKQKTETKEINDDAKPSWNPEASLSTIGLETDTKIEQVDEEIAESLVDSTLLSFMTSSGTYYCKYCIVSTKSKELFREHLQTPKHLLLVKHRNKILKN